MAYQGVLDDIQKCVNLEIPSRIPVFAISEEFDVKVCNMVYEDYCRNADQMARCQIEAIERFGYDWCWLQVDDCIEFEPLGVGTKGGGNIVRGTCAYLPPTAETLRRLKAPDPHRDGRMPVLLDAISKVKAHFGDTICVTGRTAAPFTSVTLLYGIDEAMLLPYTNEPLLRETMDFFIELQTQFGLAQLEAGADAIWLGDCNASSHLISPEWFQQYAFEPIKRVAEAYQEAGGFTFFHASEDGRSLPIMAALGVSVLSSGPEIDIEDAVAVTRDKVCYMGNLDPIQVIQLGSVEDVAKDTARTMEIGKAVTGYIFNSGEMIPRDTPIENMEAMMKTAREHGRL